MRSPSQPPPCGTVSPGELRARSAQRLAHHSARRCVLPKGRGTSSPEVAHRHHPPCDVIRGSQGGVWHWHGGAPDGFMTHFSMSEGVADVASTSGPDIPRGSEPHLSRT
jgi:hypothetical protein